MASAQRRVLVIGGTGFLGRRITEAFAAAGDRVAVLTRGARPLADLTNVELIAADRADAQALRHALADRSFDVVVDNIAYDGDGVRTLFDVLKGRIGHYLQTSSSAVYANRYVRRPLREREADLALRLPVDAPNPFHSRLGQGYANGKRAAEQVAGDSEIPWTILRPPVVLASDDRTRRVWWFVQRLLDGKPLLIPDWGSGRVFQLAWTYDIARAFCAAAGNASTFGRAYNVAQAEIYTAETWIEASAALLGVPPRYAHMAEDSADERGLPGYAMPIAGRPFGHVLVDLGALRQDTGFEPSPEDTWLRETILGCADSPPQGDSAGYDRRGDEVRAARQLTVTACR